MLALIERGECEQVSTIVNDLLRAANDSQTALRMLVHELRSDEPFQFQHGLTAALAGLAIGLEDQRDFQVRVSLAEEPELAPNTKATLARIAREALRNIEKHAQATRVDLALEVDASGVTLLIADNGRGFDPYASYPGHFGLQLVQEQARAVGATLELASAPGRGTQVRVRLGRPHR